MKHRREMSNHTAAFGSHNDHTQYAEATDHTPPKELSRLRKGQAATATPTVGPASPVIEIAIKPH